MSGRQGRADNLRELTLQELRDAETTSDSLDDEYLAALASLKAAEDLQKELAQVKHELAVERKTRRQAQLESLIFEDIIGTGTSATSHPSEGLDIVVASDLSALIANIRAQINNEAFSQGPIAFIPVRIWPVTVQPSEDGKSSFGIRGNPCLTITDRKSGEPIPNRELGRTRVQGSYAVAQVLVDGRPCFVSLSGMARVAVNPFGGLDPDDITGRLDRTARWDRWSNSVAEVVRGPDGTPQQDDEGPPFIPSVAADAPATRFAAGGTERGRIQDRAGLNNRVDDIEDRPPVPIDDTDDL